ncbi:BTB/POZ domain and ankyrin repeat-containing protein NPR1-like [Ziziphus jujuba]|uniref:BTB/POZ domain and ankyrin repeat-containing protein NPR1-like n=1 Tax=Ziziphus jujuba TaxID=326968 RepID=A0ABM4A6D1_ZIZJJ|nr:BTB/POZ domain and ankyrin repeat-containing protein NPR1-like [Ziziphus jujuba]
MADDLHVMLNLLEDRVAYARLLFPAEARIVMEADAHSTSTYTGLSELKGLNENLTEVDLNETPSVQKKKLQERVQALMKTVEKGRRYFPHCSEVLDKFLDDDDMPDVYFLEKGTPDEQRLKKMRYMELKEDVQKAFYKDMAEKNWSGLSTTSSSSCTSSPKEGVNYRVRRLAKM